MKQLYLETFGCQMNVADTDRMELLLFQAGYLRTPRREEADLILVNTCSIREKAEQKVFSLFGHLRPLKLTNPDLILGLAGCLAQQEQDRLLTAMPFLDFILGPDAIESVPDLVAQVQARRQPLVRTRFDREKQYSIPPVATLKPAGPSVFINIIKGCDKFCSFCVVPHTRGREKSREAEEIYREARSLVKRGAREIILLGQNVNSYGKSGLDTLVSFDELLHGVAATPGLKRLRFTTSHPMDFTRQVIHAYRDLAPLMRHLHLPVQSGSDRILHRMRRHHTVENYLDLIDELKRTVPGIAISTDVIVGFPGETETDFEATLGLMEEVGFDNSYMFSYSPRPNTPATEYEDSVPPEVKRERLQRVIDLQGRLTRERGRRFAGSQVEVLIENATSRKSADFRGRNPEYWNVLIEGGVGRLHPGDIVRVHVEDTTGHALKARFPSGGQVQEPSLAAASGPHTHR
ncbi:MAG: tRNA (N6-isopentenyl adenosine(37)-C2)-methylthiotransferase MiaB [Nitrospinaceae bacterium]